MRRTLETIETRRKSSAETPPWLESVLEAGFKPYVATSKHFLSKLNLSPFGIDVKPFLIDSPKDKPFLDAYLSANFISFGSKDLDYKMPSWVYVDCVLMAGAITGFMLPKSKVSHDVLKEIQADSPESYDRMTYIPISGQVDVKALDGSYVNFSLFSLGRRQNGFQKLAVYTKALSTEVHGMRNSGLDYRVILQYDNPSIKVHGLLSSQVEIEHPMVLLHPGKQMTLIAKMLVDYDPQKLDAKSILTKPSFWLEARDEATKRRMQERIQLGYKYLLVPPYAKRTDGQIWVAVSEQAPRP